MNCVQNAVFNSVLMIVLFVRRVMIFDATVMRFPVTVVGDTTVQKLQTSVASVMASLVRSISVLV